MIYDMYLVVILLVILVSKYLGFFVLLVIQSPEAKKWARFGSNWFNRDVLGCFKKNNLEYLR